MVCSTTCSEKISSSQAVGLLRFILGEDHSHLCELIQQQISDADLIDVDWFLNRLKGLCELMRDKAKVASVDKLIESRLKAFQLELQYKNLRQKMDETLDDLDNLQRNCVCPIGAVKAYDDDRIFHCPICFKVPD